MGIDTEKIKDALDSFENDKFVDAKEILSTEIGRVKNEFLKDKLGLKDWGKVEDPVDTSEED
jgi:hypothetical protein